MTEREPCGCRHDGTKWLELCPTHRTEHDTRHVQAADDHKAAEAAKRFKELF